MKRLNGNNLLRFSIKRKLIYPVEETQTHALKTDHRIVKNDNQKRKKSMEIIPRKLLELQMKMLVQMRLNPVRRMETGIAQGRRRLR